MDFKQKFEIETGNSIYSGNGQMLPEGTYSDDFVEYLLKQLNIGFVSKSVALKYAQYCLGCDSEKIQIVSLDEYIEKHCC